MGPYTWFGRWLQTGLNDGMQEARPVPAWVIFNHVLQKSFTALVGFFGFFVLYRISFYFTTERSLRIAFKQHSFQVKTTFRDLIVLLGKRNTTMELQLHIQCCLPICLQQTIFTVVQAMNSLWTILRLKCIHREHLNNPEQQINSNQKIRFIAQMCARSGVDQILFLKSFFDVILME